MALDFFGRRELERQIELTQSEITLAMWQVPADIERTKTLISRKTGLRILLGEIHVKLKRPVEISTLAA